MNANSHMKKSQRVTMMADVPETIVGFSTLSLKLTFPILFYTEGASRTTHFKTKGDTWEGAKEANFSEDKKGKWKIIVQK